MNTITDLNPGKWRSPYRPADDDIISLCNRHAARVRHRNRPRRWALRLPQLRSRRIR